MSALGFGPEYFETRYRNYDAQNPCRKLAFYERSIVSQFDQTGRELRVLDIGCGLGAFAGHVASLPNFRVAATDVDEDVIARNRRRYPQVDFVRAGAGDVPFDPATFDVITALDVLEHLSDRDMAVEAVKTMLRPDGVFFVVVPVYDGLSGPVIRRLDKDPTHLHRLSRQEWLDWIGRRFRVVTWQGMIRYLLPGPYYLHVATRVLRAHTPAIAITCRAR